MPLIINDMIKKCRGRKRDILKELKKLNLKAREVMVTPRYRFDMKYKALQTKPFWDQAKHLLIEYFTDTKPYICKVCNQELDLEKATMHHAQYNLDEYFTPNFINFIHYQCHSKRLDKRGKEK